MNLVIVESPAKAKTINKYLGDNYTVLASYGHIRDLPSKNGSVDPDQNSINISEEMVDFAGLLNKVNFICVGIPSSKVLSINIFTHLFF